jgi:hypothetical protein
MFGLLNSTEVAAGERVRLLSSWPPGDYSWPKRHELDGWNARHIYLVQDALDADPAAFPSRKYGPEFAMIYLLGRRAALTAQNHPNCGHSSKPNVVQTFRVALPINQSLSAFAPFESAKFG